MGYYPLFVELKDRTCVVVGGGPVAERKVMGLADTGARIKVISPKITKNLGRLASSRKIEHIKRAFRSGDLDGAFIAIGATSSKKTNERIHEEAEKRNVLVNIVDRPGLSRFISPSVVDRGGLKLAITTSGKCPLLSKTIRKELEKSFPQEYALFVEILGEVRKRLLKEGIKNDKKDRIILDLINSPMLKWIKERSRSRINSALKRALGPGITLSRLGVKL